MQLLSYVGAYPAGIFDTSAAGGAGDKYELCQTFVFWETCHILTQSQTIMQLGNQPTNQTTD